MPVTNMSPTIADDRSRNQNPADLDISVPSFEDQSSATAIDTPKKNQALLHVPSRSSSHKIQPSPTSTALSGATASDPTDSIGGQSKESNSSIIDKKRNDSLTSSKTSAISPAVAGRKAGEVNATTSQSAPMQKPKKSRGFFSFLNCCSVPDNVNGINSEEAVLPVKPLATVPSQARATTSSKPISSSSDPNSGQGQTLQGEKVAMVGDEHDKPTANPTRDSRLSAEEGAPGKPSGSVDQQSSSKDSRNQPLPAIPQDAEKSAMDPEVYGTSNPTVFMQAPTSNLPQPDNSGLASTRTINDDESSHVTSEEPLPMAAQESNVTEMEDARPNNTTLPPHPIPVSEISSTSSSSPQQSNIADPVEEKQQWLLPPIEPRFKGKKCLVLDLDETLVHSSFKVFEMGTYVV